MAGRMAKLGLTERDVCTKFILPANKRVGWGDMLHVREEAFFTQGRKEAQQTWRVAAEEFKTRGYGLDIQNPYKIAQFYSDPETLIADLEKVERSELRDRLKEVLIEALLR